MRYTLCSIPYAKKMANFFMDYITVYITYRSLSRMLVLRNRKTIRPG